MNYSQDLQFGSLSTTARIGFRLRLILALFPLDSRRASKKSLSTLKKKKSKRILVCRLLGYCPLEDALEKGGNEHRYLHRCTPVLSARREPKEDTSLMIPLSPVTRRPWTTRCVRPGRSLIFPSALVWRALASALAAGTTVSGKRKRIVLPVFLAGGRIFRPRGAFTTFNKLSTEGHSPTALMRIINVAFLIKRETKKRVPFTAGSGSCFLRASQQCENQRKAVQHIQW